MSTMLTKNQLEVHERAVQLSREFCRVEGELILVLGEIDQLKFFRRLGFSSLFTYAVGCLGLSEATAYAFIAVARKGREIPELKAAVLEQRITVAKASRLVAAMTQDNAVDLVSFATTHSTRQLEAEVARLRPQAALTERARVVGEDLVKMEIGLTKATWAQLERVKSLLVAGGAMNMNDVLSKVLDEYLSCHDPVRKAERALAKGLSSKQKSKNCAPSAPPSTAPAKKLCAFRATKRHRLNRVPLSARIKHEVFHRDQGRCTHVDAQGTRCISDRWLHVHHIQPVSQGGSNDAQNLTLLCSSHHDLIHQLSLPLDGQVTWLRAPQLPYKVSRRSVG